MVQASVPLLLGASAADETLAKRQRRAAVPGPLGESRVRGLGFRVQGLGCRV